MATEQLDPEAKSHRLFGRQYRLALWAAIAARAPGETFTNGELATELRLPTGHVSKELSVLVAVGLVVEGRRGGTKPFHREDSGFWDGCRSLKGEWDGPQDVAGAVIRMR